MTAISDNTQNPQTNNPQNPNQLNQPKKGAIWYKNYMVTVFVIGLPAFVVVACIFFVIYAIRAQDATVRDDWYMDGKALYQDASKDQLAYDLGVAGNMSFAGADVVRFELNFPTDSTQTGTLRNGTPLSYPASLKAVISHATDKSRDRDFELTHVKDNLYQGKVQLDPTPAKYYIQVNDDVANWRLIHAYQLPATTIALTPLPAFGQAYEGLPDQRDKRF
ncbi:MAG: FixH family protein [Moraxella sp.]|nr:FixH family protein [Moraxella sp.]